MKRSFLVCLFFLLYTSVFSQGMVLIDPVTNKPFNSDKYSAFRGSPFLYEGWKKGNATTPRGIYNNLELKLDAYENILYFNKEDVPYEFQDEILAFSIITSGDTLHYRKGVTGSNLKVNQFVQVLVDGKISFYRSDIKAISEMSEINAGMVKSFITSTRYYLNKDGKLELVKLNKDILDFMEDKKVQVKQFIDSNNLSTKKESDFARIIRYYNSI